MSLPQSSYLKNAESQSLVPTALLNLIVLDLNPIGVDLVLYIANGTNPLFKPIVFDGITYVPFPVEITESGYDGQGSIVRPKLTVGNIQGFVSKLLLQGQDIVGATVTWTKVFARFIDAVNWPNGVSPYTPDPTAAYAPEVYYIFRKTKENQQEVGWELATSFELTGRKVPNRTMLANYCQWSYRQPGTCGYSGPPIADVNNNLFSGAPYDFNALNDRGMWSASATYNRQDYVAIFSNNQALIGVPQVFICLNDGTTGSNTSPLIINNTQWKQDSCGKGLASCRLRFSYPSVLPTSMFIGLTRAGFVAGYSTSNT